MVYNLDEQLYQICSTWMKFSTDTLCDFCIVIGSKGHKSINKISKIIGRKGIFLVILNKK